MSLPGVGGNRSCRSGREPRTDDDEHSRTIHECLGVTEQAKEIIEELKHALNEMEDVLETLELALAAED
jgi:hypothetical protein